MLPRTLALLVPLSLLACSGASSPWEGGDGGAPPVAPSSTIPPSGGEGGGTATPSPEPEPVEGKVLSLPAQAAPPCAGTLYRQGADLLCLDLPAPPPCGGPVYLVEGAVVCLPAGYHLDALPSEVGEGLAHYVARAPDGSTVPAPSLPREGVTAEGVAVWIDPLAAP